MPALTLDGSVVLDITVQTPPTVSFVQGNVASAEIYVAGPQGPKGDKGDTGTAAVDAPQTWTKAHTFAPDADFTPVTIKANVSQTADLTRWTNSAGAIVGKVNSSGTEMAIASNIAIDGSGFFTIGGRARFGYTNQQVTISDNGASKTIYLNGLGAIFQNSGTNNVVSLITRGIASQTAALQQWQNSAGATLASVSAGGDITAPRLRLTAADDVSLASTLHALQIGDTATINIAIDGNEIMARNNGAVSDLHLNADGGPVRVGGTLHFNSELYGNGKRIFTTTDAFLRLNQANEFTSGIWIGNSALRGGAGGVFLGSTGGEGNIALVPGSTDGVRRITLAGNTGQIDNLGRLWNRGGGAAAGYGNTRVGNVGVQGVTGQTVGWAEVSRHELTFSSYRDVVQDTIGAKIAAVNLVHPSYLAANQVQHTELAFFTLGVVPSGADNTTERMRITRDGTVRINGHIPGVPGLSTQAAASQTAHYVEFLNSDGTPAFNIQSNGTSRVWRGMVVETKAGAGNANALHVRVAQAGGIPLIAQGAASQTADLTQWQDSAGSVIARMAASGHLRTASASVWSDRLGTAMFSVDTGDAGNPGIIVRGRPAQNADLQQWQDSAGTVLSRVNSSGWLVETFPGVVLTTGSGTADYGFLSPLATRAWFDRTRFTVPTWETSTDGTTFTGLAHQAHLLSGRTESTTTIPSAGAIRATWTGMEWSEISALFLGFSYIGVSNSVRVLIEYSPDGVAWRVGYDGSGLKASANGQYIRPTAFINGDSRLRLTIFATTGDPATGVRLNTIQFLSTRMGDQGGGVQNDTPYSWSGYKSVMFQGISAGTTPLIARGQSAQTADIQQWQDSAGNTLARVAPNGDIYVGTAKLGAVPTNMVTTDTAQTITGAKTFNAITVFNSTVDLNNANSDGNRWIATWQNTDRNWRIGMGSANAGTYGVGAGFIRKYSTGHVQYITYYPAATYGFAVGPQTTNTNGSLSHLEIRSSDGHTFVRNNLEVGGGNPGPSLVVAQAASQTADLVQWRNSAGTAIGGVTAAGMTTAQGFATLIDGTAATPSYRFGTASNSGMYQPSTDAVAISTNGVMAVQWATGGRQYNYGNTYLSREAKYIKNLYSGLGGDLVRTYDHVAAYTSNSSGVTGAIMFTAPYGATNTMQRVTIEGYTYDSNAPIKIELGFYNHRPANELFSVINAGYISAGSLKPAVRVGYSPAQTPNMAAPTLTTATTGGTLAAATYYYEVSALVNGGETVPSPAASIVTTGTTSTVTVTWTAVPNATGYRIWRGVTAGSEELLTSVGAVTTYTDTGAATTVVAQPTVNTTMNNSKMVIILGETNSVWQYPKFTITRITGSHTGTTDTMMDNWTSSLVTSFANMSLTGIASKDGNFVNTVTAPGFGSTVDGTVAAPAFRFGSVSNTGLYSPTTDQAAIATGGTQRALWTTTGMNAYGTLSVLGSVAAAVQSIVRGAASQTGDLTQWQNSAGTVLSKFDRDANFYVNNRAFVGTLNYAGNYALYAQAKAAAEPVMVARGAASQTGDLMQFQDSAGAILARVANDGTIYKGSTAVGGNASDTEIMAIMGAF